MTCLCCIVSLLKCVGVVIKYVGSTYIYSLVKCKSWIKKKKQNVVFNGWVFSLCLLVKVGW